MALPLDSSDVSGVFAPKTNINWRRIVFLLAGIALFALTYVSPAWPEATDPKGAVIGLSHEGKAAIGLFLLAGLWWVTEALPIGVTAIAIGVVQALFQIREPRVAFTDFMDPSVWFIFGSLTIGMVFTKTGLTKRLAYRMLTLVGERTSMIYLGCFVLTAALTLLMAHTAVAATVYPLFVAIYALYTEDEKPTRFGKGLFMGMAFVAGAGSIITLLGAARGAVAIGFFRDITGKNVGFFELIFYMLPVGVLMTILLWLFFLLYYKPEKKIIPGLTQRVQRLYQGLGPITAKEILAVVTVGGVILLLGLRAGIPALGNLDKAAVLLMATLLFFVFNIVTLDDLELLPWNIILLFGGAMSIGYCLWQTGAARWIAVHWLALFVDAHWFVFVMGITGFVLLLTNFIMNVAAIAITLPVAFVIAQYLGVAPEVILYAALVAAGMPFLFLVGAAPNAIAYASKQFTTKEFFVAGIPTSIVLIVVIGFFVAVVWPVMGMPILLK